MTNYMNHTKNEALKMMEFDLQHIGINGMIELTNNIPQSSTESFFKSTYRDNVEKLIHNFIFLDNDLEMISNFGYFHDIGEGYVDFIDNSCQNKNLHPIVSFEFLQKNITTSKYLLFCIKHQNILSSSINNCSDIKIEPFTSDCLISSSKELLGTVFSGTISREIDFSWFSQIAEEFFVNEQESIIGLKLLGYAILFSLIAKCDFDTINSCFSKLKNLIRINELSLISSVV